MLVSRHRVAAAGVITAAAIAVPAVALASGPGSPSGKSAPPPAAAASASKSPAAAEQQTAKQGTRQAQPDLPPAPVTALAARLGVSASAAGRAFKQIAALSGKNGVDPASPAVAAAARDLGVTPAKLAAAWNAVNRSTAGNQSAAGK
jgi:hypothetical protein